jgi:tyrosine-protein phosphatase SIW14
MEIVEVPLNETPAEVAPLRNKRIWTRIGGMAIAVGLLLALWTYVLKDHFIVKKWGVIVPGVAFRSGQISQYLVHESLKKHEIQHIICMTSPDSKDIDQQEELRASNELNADFVYLPLNGRGVGKVEHFTKAVVLLTQDIQKQEPVLVHCHAGAQRTGGIVAAYRLLIENRSTEFVIEELEAYGWNRRRDQILLDFINENLRKAAEELVAAGCLEQVPDELPVLK